MENFNFEPNDLFRVLGEIFEPQPNTIEFRPVHEPLFNRWKVVRYLNGKINRGNNKYFESEHEAKKAAFEMTLKVLETNPN